MASKQFPNKVSPMSMKKGSNYVVLFHMNGCPACVNFMPTWKQLYDTVYHDNRLNVDLIHVEMNDITNIASKNVLLTGPANAIAYFPTILFYSAKTQQFEEHRDSRDFVTMHALLKERFAVAPKAAKKAPAVAPKAAKKASTPKASPQKGGDCGCNGPLPLLPGALPMAGGKKPTKAKGKTPAKGQSKKKPVRRPQSGGFVRGGVTLPESFYSRS